MDESWKTKTSKQIPPFGLFDINYQEEVSYVGIALSPQVTSNCSTKEALIKSISYGQPTSRVGTHSDKYLFCIKVR